MAELKDVELLQAELAKVTKERDELLADLKSLNEELAKLQANPGKRQLLTVKIGKEEYSIAFPKVELNGTVYTAQQIRDNKEKVDGVSICEYLLKHNTGVLVKKGG